MDGNDWSASRFILEESLMIIWVKDRDSKRVLPYKNCYCCANLPVTLTNRDSKRWRGTVSPRPLGHEYKVSCCKYRGSNNNGGMCGSLVLSKIKSHFNAEISRTEHRRTGGVIGVVSSTASRPRERKKNPVYRLLIHTLRYCL